MSPGHDKHRPIPELINVTQLAELLNLSVRTVWRLNAQGKLPAPLRLGRSVKWRKNEIYEWLANLCPTHSLVSSRR
ncbi:MAG: helix-turn-helix domain-containing protein [Pirellulaceae bacterium]